MSVRVCITIDAERRKKAAAFDGIDSDLSKIVDALRPHCKATFFVTGEVARNVPEAVRALLREGHEVSCHGLYHERFDTLRPDEQFERIDLATQYIANATGSSPLGFRAPEHRADAATIAALERRGYMYDSSVLPRTPFMHPQAYKKWRFLVAPASPYHPSRTSIIRHGDSPVLELPISTMFFPFLSSLSMRSNFVSDVIATLLVHKSKMTGAPIIYYLHSYDSSLRRGDLMWLQRVLRTLQKHRVEFLTMHQLAVKCRDVKLGR